MSGIYAYDVLVFGSGFYVFIECEVQSVCVLLVCVLFSAFPGKWFSTCLQYSNPSCIHPSKIYILLLSCVFAPVLVYFGERVFLYRISQKGLRDYEGGNILDLFNLKYIRLEWLRQFVTFFIWSLYEPIHLFFPLR